MSFYFERKTFSHCWADAGTIFHLRPPSEGLMFGKITRNLQPILCLGNWLMCSIFNATDSDASAHVLVYVFEVVTFLSGGFEGALWTDSAVCSWLWKQSGVRNDAHLCVPDRWTGRVSVTDSKYDTCCVCSSYNVLVWSLFSLCFQMERWRCPPPVPRLCWETWL